MTGQIKNIATTAVGYFSFGDVTYNVWNVVGLAVGVVASTWYSWLKYVESEKSKKPVLPLHNEKEADDASSVSGTDSAQSDNEHGHSHANHGPTHHGHSHSHGGGNHGHSH